MQLNIEVTENEIKSAIERKVRVIIADQCNSWTADDFIKAEVKKQWMDAVSRVVQECLQDTPAIKAKIQAAIEARLKGQLAAIMKASSK